MAPNPFFTSPRLLHFPSSLPAIFSLHSPQSRSIPSQFNKALQGTFFEAPVACSASRSPSPIASSNVEPEGTGAAAPSPGERFIEHQNAKATAALVLKQSGSREKKKKKNRRGEAVLSSVAACCYGCGAPLQIEALDAPGYVDPAMFELKKRHHQLGTKLCGRCKLLSHGHMVTAVGGHGGYSGGKRFILAEELREKLSDIRYDKVLIIKLVDIVDFSGSFMARIRDLVGANPIILVVAKVDLLPKGTDLNCVGDWVVEATVKKKLNVLSVSTLLVLSLWLGLLVLYQRFKRRERGGMSILWDQQMLESPLSSVLYLNFFDTPGIHFHHRQAAVVHSEDLPSLAPQCRLRGRSFPVVSKSNLTGIDTANLNGFSIFWGGLVRIDVFKVLPQTRLTFFGPPKLQIMVVPTAESDEFYHKEVRVLLTPPSEKQRELWPGLQSVRQLKIKFEDQKRPASDIAISGLGWISVEPVGVNVCQNESVEMAVHVPKSVEIFVRPPLPVGSTGAEWYSYQELTEEEEELRPKWYY